MNEDFVTYELAIKLKEKGFNLHCVSFYALENFTAEYVDSCGDCYEVDFEKGILYLNYPLRYKKFEEKMLPAPTISQVLKWLRDKKKIYIVIAVNPTLSTKDKIAYYYQVYSNSNGVTSDYYESEECYAQWEECAIDSIKYVLYNLI